MSTSEAAAIKAQIRAAFGAATRPAAGRLHASIESDEASTLLEADFADKGTWESLDPTFVDQAPDGFGSALSFFTPEAFRYFLPAYLVAHLDDRLVQADPVFHLVHGLDDASSQQPINPRRYGDRTWLSAATEKHAGFTREQVAAIVAFLRYEAARDDFNRAAIGEALDNYWLPRLAPS